MQKPEGTVPRLPQQDSEGPKPPERVTSPSGLSPDGVDRGRDRPAPLGPGPRVTRGGTLGALPRPSCRRYACCACRLIDDGDLLRRYRRVAGNLIREPVRRQALPTTACPPLGWRRGPGPRHPSP